MSSVETIIESRTFSTLLSEARSFCKFIESDERIDTATFLKLTQSHLHNLYIFGQQLEYADLNYNVDFDDMMIHSDFKVIVNTVTNKIGDKTLYWTIFDPTDFSDYEPVCGDLLDDVCEIYKDIKNVLLLFDTQEPAEIEAAIWSLKSSFVIHWSFHCINAIYALHYIILRTA